MYKWYLPTLSELIALSDATPNHSSGSPAQQRVRAEREWSGAIAALNLLLQQVGHGEISASEAHCSSDGAPIRGMVLSGPLPILNQPDLMAGFATWTFTAEFVSTVGWMPTQLLPASGEKTAIAELTASTLPLLPSDPLAAEQFSLVMTSEFSLVMALGENAEGVPAFMFSFDPEVVWQAWRSLRSRLLMTNPPSLLKLDALAEQFSPPTPSYQTVMQFSRLMLAHLPEGLDDDHRDLVSHGHHLTDPLSTSLHTLKRTRSAFLKRSHLAAPSASVEKTDPLEKLAHGQTSTDVELLQAIAHEVRTPLTTIRTLTRLLMKRKDLSPDVVKRLEIIDRECTDQIDRFSLIFRAVELETAAVKRPLTPLASISLVQVFQQSLPRWQQQANQRNLTLDVLLPQKLPLVVTDPIMLDQVLTGLIDRITHSLPPDSHIQVRVKLAGHQLKLQFQSHPHTDQSLEAAARDGKACGLPSLKSIGQMLMFQPETGNLSLNLTVTKNLFQALGGKLIVRQRPQQGEILTVFLPLETRKSDDLGEEDWQ